MSASATPLLEVRELSCRFGGLMAPAGTFPPVVAKLTKACEGAAKDEAYKVTTERAAQPPDYYADAALFRQRLQRDIERKAVVLSRLKTPAPQ